MQQDLEWIRQLIGVIAQELVQAIDDAVTAVMTIDRDRAATTVLGDYTINRQTRELDRLCHAFVARHLPSAGHLRYVSAVLRLSIALERIGDYAATIGHTVAQLTAPPPTAVGRDIEMMAEQARRLLADAMQAFDRRDAELAHATITAAERFARHFDRVFADLVREGEGGARPLTDLFALMATFNRLERIIHQAKNVSEETLFVVTGKAKSEKTFNLLFVDAANTGPSQLAEHCARKAFPNSGRYDSAGWDHGEQVERAYREFAATLGIDMRAAWPTGLDALSQQLDQYHFVVGLAGDTRPHLPRLPFHTASIVWDIDATGGPEAVHRQLVPRIRDLMERLRAEHAN